MNLIQATTAPWGKLSEWLMPADGGMAHAPGRIWKLGGDGGEE